MRMYENKRFRMYEALQNPTDSIDARKAIRLKLCPNCKQCTVLYARMSVHIRGCKMCSSTLSMWSVFWSVFREKLISVFSLVPTTLLSVYASRRCVLLELLLCTRCLKSTHKLQRLLDPAIFGTNIPFKNSSARKKSLNRQAYVTVQVVRYIATARWIPHFYLIEVLLMFKTKQLWINTFHHWLFLQTSNETLR
jgi:hypothetical protein